MRRALAATLLLAAAAVRADDQDLRLTLTLHGRVTDLENAPSTAVLYDAARRSFDVGSYLSPATQDLYASGYLAAGAEGRLGRLRWGLLADTGEIREQAFPAAVDACFSTRGTPATGLAAPGGGRCDVLLDGVPRALSLASTRLAPAGVTSNGRAFADEARSTVLLREAWVGAVLGRNDFVRVRAGRRRFTVADGLVYDDWGLGAEVGLDLGAIGPSWDVGMAAIYPSRDYPSGSGWTSILASFHADYLPSLFEHVGVFAAWFRDRSDVVVELFRGTLAEPSAVALRNLAPGSAEYAHEARLLALQLAAPLRGDADLGWAGTSGALHVLGGHLDWTAAFAFGAVTVPTVTLLEVSPTALRGGVSYRAHSVFGQAARVRLREPLGDDWQVTGFALFLSGDALPTEKARRGEAATYGGFLGVSPYLTETNIFFNGGVADTFAARQASAPGVNGRGVIAPGAAITYEPGPELLVDARAAYLVAAAHGPYGGWVYGPEVDLEARWAATSWLNLVGEADALFAGDFFARHGTVTKVVVGLDLVAFR